MERGAVGCMAARKEAAPEGNQQRLEAQQIYQGNDRRAEKKMRKLVRDVVHFLKMLRT